MYREVVLVLSEHLDRVKAEYAKIAFSDVHCIPYGEFYLLSIYSHSIGKVTNCRQELANLGIAINAVAMDDNSRTADLTRWQYVCRFDHMGTQKQEFKYPSSDELVETTCQLLLKKLWPDGAYGRLAELRAYCIAQADGWENQAQYGRLYTMMRLLEAEE